MGVIENDDPGEGPNLGVRVHATPDAEITRAAVAAIVDRIRDSDVIPEALKATARDRWAMEPDPSEFCDWLRSELRELDEPAMITCDCGTVLIDPTSWTGRATVRCESCRSRWGIEVRDAHIWSVWTLPDPSQ